MTTTHHQRGDQLTFSIVDRVPPQLRVSEQTRRVGQRGIAAVRALLAEQASRQHGLATLQPPRREKRAA